MESYFVCLKKVSSLHCLLHTGLGQVQFWVQPLVSSNHHILGRLLTWLDNQPKQESHVLLMNANSCILLDLAKKLYRTTSSKSLSLQIGLLNPCIHWHAVKVIEKYIPCIVHRGMVVSGIYDWPDNSEVRYTSLGKSTCRCTHVHWNSEWDLQLSWLEEKS